jgi:hypothetical protein
MKESGKERRWESGYMGRQEGGKEGGKVGRTEGVNRRI